MAYFYFTPLIKQFCNAITENCGRPCANEKVKSMLKIIERNIICKLIKGFAM